MSASSATAIVIGVDGSDESMHALRQGVKFADALTAEVVVTFVRKLPTLVGDETGDVIGAYEESLDASEDEARARAEEILKSTDRPWVVEVRDGDPGKELVDAAHEHAASLVVVGATMHGAVTSVVLASVASYLMHHCDVSFVVVRPEPTEEPPEA